MRIVPRGAVIHAPSIFVPRYLLGGVQQQQVVPEEDADLIMLGLLSHDPHFCLLREEVKFGPASKSKGNKR